MISDLTPEEKTILSKRIEELKNWTDMLKKDLDTTEQEIKVLEKILENDK